MDIKYLVTATASVNQTENIDHIHTWTCYLILTTFTSILHPPMMIGIPGPCAAFRVNALAITRMMMLCQAPFRFDATNCRLRSWVGDKLHSLIIRAKTIKQLFLHRRIASLQQYIPFSHPLQAKIRVEDLNPITTVTKDSGRITLQHSKGCHLSGLPSVRLLRRLGLTLLRCTVHNRQHHILLTNVLEIAMLFENVRIARCTGHAPKSFERRFLPEVALFPVEF